MIINTEKISKNVTVTHIPDDKFKAGYISVYFASPRTRQSVSNNVLLSRVMTTACQKFDTPLKLDKELENLYDAELFPISEPIGQYHIMGFRIKIVQEDYISENITDKALDLLGEIISHPLVEQNGFNEKYFKLEKNRLLQIIASDINDKVSYSRIRANELMFAGSAQGIRASGYKEEVEKITPKALYEYYKKLINSSKINISFAGKFDIDNAGKKIEQIINHEPQVEKVKEIEIIKQKPLEQFVEKMDVTQAKMVMYYTFGISDQDEDYYPFIVCNSVFGGGAHSKLFMNVREKHSICYSIISSIQKFTGTMSVYSAIEPENYEKAVELIGEQMQDMKDGKITQEELNSAKKSYITALNTLKDRLSDMSDFFYRQSFTKSPKTIDEIIELIDKVTISDIIKVANKAQLCYKYLLTKN